MGVSDAAISRQTSQTIRNARVLCILFMMTVHVWPGAERILSASVPWSHHLFFATVVDYFGRGVIGAVNGLERHIFVVFCSHYVTLKFMGLVALLGSLTEDSPFYLAFFLVQIAVCVAVGVLLSVLLRDVPVANGWRRSRPKPGLVAAAE